MLPEVKNNIDSKKLKGVSRPGSGFHGKRKGRFLQFKVVNVSIRREPPRAPLEKKFSENLGKMYEKHL